ncbi:hypothetical protein ACGFYU_32285 [Streptomyces sp. NPDC048337]|uniref:hypothetical protein n=1 Tax=Streptomyces sp. NPDC048337 TaxID=3365535 RepID=UPI00371C675F
MRQIPVDTSAAREVLSIDIADTPSVRVAALVEPSADLLDRAHVGWEHFLSTQEESSDD